LTFLIFKSLLTYLNLVSEVNVLSFSFQTNGHMLLYQGIQDLQFYTMGKIRRNWARKRFKNHSRL